MQGWPVSEAAETATGLVAVGDLRTAVVSGGAGPGRLGGRYHQIGPASVNDAGAVAFAATLVGAATVSAIVRLVGDRDTVLVRAGELAPGGGRYASFGELDLGDDGCLLFQARLVDTDATEGVFLRTAAGTRAVARTGTDYASFQQLTLTSYPVDGSPYFRLAYTAMLPDGRKRLLIWPSYREPSAVLTTGDTVAGGVLEDFMISRLGFATCVLARVRNGGTSRRWALLVSEDQVIWGHRVRDGARFPGLGRIARLLGPGAVFVHNGFVAAELDDGRSMLLTRSGGGDPQVFAHSGDPAPGMPARITSFGPPLANHGLTGDAPCGIASIATLDDGCAALWLGVFPVQQPMAGAAVIPLVAGDHTDDELAACVKTFTPLKLTNTGTLLLRSTLDLDGRAADGLLLLDRLFDWRRPT